MAKDVQDTIREVLTNAVEEAAKSLSPSGNGKLSRNGKSKGPLSGVKGIAAGAGAAALAPLAAKGVGKLAKTIGAEGLSDVASAPGKAVSGATSKLGDSVGSSIGDKISSKVDEAGGPSGILKDTVKGALPFGGGDDEAQPGSKGGVPGVGKGRRMPVQQSIDIAVPIETAYNQWTQFELWPNFMHRVTRVTQEDDCTVSFATKIWGKTKEFTAQIETQRPDERLKWRVTNGITHTGVVTFHELAPRLTRVEINLDVEPGGMLEKAARGLRHIKRAVRADLHRFKAFIEMQEQETGAWRGVIEEGELVEEHDPSYDKNRDYSDFEDALPDSDEDEDEDEDEDDEQPRSRSRGQSRSSGSRSQSKSSGRSGGSRSQSSGSQSRSRGRSQSKSSGRSQSKSGGRSQSRSSSSSRSSGSSRNGSSGQSSSGRARSRRSSSGNHSNGGQRSGSTRRRS